jgi:hypothetical protein
VRRVLKGPATMPDDHQFFDFSAHYYHHHDSVQEFRSRDIVVELSGLTLPTQAAQPQKNSAFKLALFSPHDVCREENTTAKCYGHQMWSCDITKLTSSQTGTETLHAIQSDFKTPWRLQQARMQIWRDRAQQRRLGAMMLPSLKDVIGQRMWFKTKGEQLQQSTDQHIALKVCLWQLFRMHGQSGLSSRTWERICWILDFLDVGLHYCQLTPVEHNAVVQLPFVQRLELHAEARGCSRDKNDFWKTIAAGVNFQEDAEEGDVIEVEEGVPHDMEDIPLDVEDS